MVKVTELIIELLNVTTYTVPLSVRCSVDMEQCSDCYWSIGLGRGSWSCHWWTSSVVYASKSEM